MLLVITVILHYNCSLDIEQKALALFSDWSIIMRVMGLLPCLPL